MKYLNFICRLSGVLLFIILATQYCILHIEPTPFQAMLCLLLLLDKD